MPNQKDFDKTKTALEMQERGMFDDEEPDYFTMASERLNRPGTEPMPNMPEGPNYNASVGMPSPQSMPMPEPQPMVMPAGQEKIPGKKMSDNGLDETTWASILYPVATALVGGALGGKTGAYAGASAGGKGLKKYAEMKFEKDMKASNEKMIKDQKRSYPIKYYDPAMGVLRTGVFDGEHVVISELDPIAEGTVPDVSQAKILETPQGAKLWTYITHGADIPGGIQKPKESSMEQQPDTFKEEKLPSYNYDTGKMQPKSSNQPTKLPEKPKSMLPSITAPKEQKYGIITLPMDEAKSISSSAHKLETNQPLSRSDRLNLIKGSKYAALEQIYQQKAAIDDNLKQKPDESRIVYNERIKDAKKQRDELNKREDDINKQFNASQQKILDSESDNDFRMALEKENTKNSLSNAQVLEGIKHRNRLQLEAEKSKNKQSEAKIKPDQKKPAKEMAIGLRDRRLAYKNMWDALKKVDEIARKAKHAIDIEKVTPDNVYKLYANELSDIKLRLRTGAAAKDEEIQQYASQLPESKDLIFGGQAVSEKLNLIKKQVLNGAKAYGYKTIQELDADPFDPKDEQRLQWLKDHESEKDTDQYKRLENLMRKKGLWE